MSVAEKIGNFIGIVLGAIVIGAIVTAFFAGLQMLFFVSRPYDYYITVWAVWASGYATAMLVREVV